MRLLVPVLFLLSTTVLSATVVGQDRERPRFRVGAAVASGVFDYDTDGSDLDDDTDAGLFRFEFEATSARGIGGGLRFESLATDDDLFAGAGFSASEARSGTLFGHFTYRIEEHRFAMPLRIGLLLNGLTLEDDTTGDELSFGSIGPYFEVEPEVTLVRSRSTRWTLYGELGVGAAATGVELDTTGPEEGDYDSSTGFLGLEAGTRLSFGKVELSLAYVGRFQSTDESDVEGGFSILGNDVAFNGILFGVGVVF